MAGENVTQLPLPSQGGAQRRKAALRARLYRRRKRQAERHAERDAERDGQPVTTEQICDLGARIRLGMAITPAERELVDRLLMRLVRMLKRDSTIRLSKEEPK